MRWCALPLSALACVAAFAAGDLQPVRPDQPASLVRAVFAQGRTWLLGDDGRLSSVAPDEGARRKETLPEPAHDLCVSEGSPVIVTIDASRPGSAHVRRREGAEWPIDASINLDGEALVAVACSPDSVMVVGTRHLFEVRPGSGVRKLKGELDLRRGVVSAAHVTRDAVYIGTNRGEWGGGMLRIGRGDGRVTPVLKDSGTPVNAIVDDPWKPGCLVVAQGLMHFMPDGRLLEVCDGAVETLYTAKIPIERAKGGTFLADEAFFGLVVDQGGVLAVADSGLYRIDASRQASVAALPGFHDVDGVQVSFDVPGQVLVRTSANQRHSISGMTPMLVPR